MTTQTSNYANEGIKTGESNLKKFDDLNIKAYRQETPTVAEIRSKYKERRDIEEKKHVGSKNKLEKIKFERSPDNVQKVLENKRAILPKSVQ